MKLNLVVAVVALSCLVASCSSSAPAPTATSSKAAEPAATAPAAVSAAPTVAAPSKPEAAKPEAAKAEPAKTDKPAGSANPRDDLAKAFRGWGSVKSFRARITTTGLPGGQSQETTIEVQMPDRFHSTTPRAEMIKVGGDIYFKLPTGWQKIAQNVDIDFADPKKFEADIGASTESRLIGPDVFEGTPCLVYEYTTRFTGQGGPAAGAVDKAAGKVSDTYTAKVWIAVADNLPRKVESGDPSSTARSTIVYYDFNAPITINPPV